MIYQCPKKLCPQVE